MQLSRTYVSERGNYYVPVLSYLTIQFISLGLKSVDTHILVCYLRKTTGNCSERLEYIQISQINKVLAMRISKANCFYIPVKPNFKIALSSHKKKNNKCSIIFRSRDNANTTLDQL